MTPFRVRFYLSFFCSAEGMNKVCHAHIPNARSIFFSNALLPRYPEFHLKFKGFVRLSLEDERFFCRIFYVWSFLAELVERLVKKK